MIATVILIHGFGSSSRAWTPQVNGHLGVDRLLAPDLPGHGDHQGSFTMCRAISSLRSIVDHSRLPVHLVGISGGATIALLTHLANPNPIASLLLSAPVVSPPKSLPVHRALTRLAPNRVLTHSLQHLLAGDQPNHLVTAREDLRRCGKDNFLAALRGIAHLDLRNRLASITTPTLITCGERDRANLATSRQVAAGIPGAEFRIIPDATHFWNLQRPALFNRTLTSFIRQATG
jgi:pimeloyl-ACP methyl ester carboxylesterase